ncbi:MAG TPA: hypothetical protein VFF43_16325 [Caldimonas sp.]|nr:hypothetical protein [Caldimonas sp.]
MTTPKPPYSAELPDDPLIVARLMMEAIARIGDQHDGSPDADLRAYIEGWGRRQHEIGEHVQVCALVSIAGDLRRIADHGWASQLLDERLDRLDVLLGRLGEHLS